MSRYVRSCLILGAGLLAVCIACSSTAVQGQVEQQAKLLSVDAMDTDIIFLLRTLAVESGQNIVIGKDVKGKVTAKLKNLPLTEILGHLTKSNGMSWALSDGAYVVSVADPKATEAVTIPEDAAVTQVWRCRYHRHTDLTAMLTKLFPRLTVTSGPSHADPELDSTAAAATGSAVGDTSGSGGEQTSLTPGTVILLGPQAIVDQAMDILAKVDIRRPQVVVEASVSEISDDVSSNLGITWSWSNIGLSEAGPDKGIAFGSITRTGMSFEGVLEALSKDGKAKLLARPSLSVVDGGHGSILIGDRLIYPKVIGYTQLNTPIYDIEEEKVGIYLQIAPVIGEDGYITMTVYPQVSVIKGFLMVQGSQYPQIATREAKTTVRLKQGERLAIGGLMRDDEIDTITKIPLLGDLPILKSLFRHRSKTTNRTEIVIILTPRIVDGDETAKAGGPVSG